MSDRPTPETDAAYKYWPSENAELVDADFARNLERERDEALTVADTLSGIASAYLGWQLSQIPNGADDRSLEVARNVTAAIKRWKELKRSSVRTTFQKVK